MIISQVLQLIWFRYLTSGIPALLIPKTRMIHWRKRERTVISFEKVNTSTWRKLSTCLPLALFLYLYCIYFVYTNYKILISFHSRSYFFHTRTCFVLYVKMIWIPLISFDFIWEIISWLVFGPAGLKSYLKLTKIIRSFRCSWNQA